MASFGSLIFTIASTGAFADGLGPLNITNNFPTTILFSNYTPESTQVMDKNDFLFRFGVTEANTIIKDKSGDTEVLVDLELTRVHLNLFAGVTDNFEFGIELPFLFYHRGFMDAPIEWIEDRLGKSSERRKELSQNDIRFLLIKNGETIYDIDNSQKGIGDMSLKFKYLILKEKNYYPDMSVKFDLSVPTGMESRLLGAGKPSFGTALLMHKSYNKLHFELHFSYIVLSDIEFENSTFRIETSNFLNSLLAIEYVLKDISWILQFSASSNPFKKFGIEDISSDGQAIAVGFKKEIFDKWIVQLAFTENISSVAYPDFAADLLLEYRFNY